MLKEIRINFETIEMMQFYWESIVQRDKLVDSFFIELAERPEMQVLYDEEFSEESIRKVLSAIMNRERVNHPTQKESRFWNLNMWMLEDLDNMRAMLHPIKLLNINELKAEFSGDTAVEELTISFVPGHMETCYTEGSTLTINFFKLMADPMDPEIVKVEGLDFREFVLEKAREVIKG